MILVDLHAHLLIAFIGLISIPQSITCLLRLKDCKCRSRVEPRIANGNQINHIYPWMVSVGFGLEIFFPLSSELNFYKKNMHLCGGVLVNERFVLTAAHCVFDLYDDQITSGRLNVGWGDSLTDIYDRGRVLVSRVHLHPDFNVTAEKSIGGSNQKSGVDLAMLELATPVSFNPLPGQTEPELGPACLHWNIWELFGSQYSTVGWGIERQMLTSQRKLMRFESPLSNRLQQVPLVELGRRHPACRARSDLQCFQPLWARQMLCVGDSGGPLHLKHRGIHKVIGILSFGVQIPKYECMPNAVFSSISASKDWIQNLVEQDLCPV